MKARDCLLFPVLAMSLLLPADGPGRFRIEITKVGLQSSNERSAQYQLYWPTVGVGCTQGWAALPL
jgi:hypothetical protein